MGAGLGEGEELKESLAYAHLFWSTRGHMVQLISERAKAEILEGLCLALSQVNRAGHL